ncbi:DBB domain-containing protein stumps isoform X4 [Oratosquilla oratoria]|uniref:DBB domain-containing protein stumps isoform X4 n=1 Tax=Oratosquilla oratoria TaxID=337810 RepID=UPI003F7739C6
MHHVYMNDPANIDEADHGFLTDSTVYYNLPPPAPSSAVPGYSSSSCSASSSPSPRAMRSLRRSSEKGYNTHLHTTSAISASAPSSVYPRRHTKANAQTNVKGLAGSSRQSVGLPPVPSNLPEESDQSKTYTSSRVGAPPVTTQPSSGGTSLSILPATLSLMPSSTTSGSSSMDITQDASSQNPDTTSGKASNSPQRSKTQRNHLKKKLAQTRSFDLGYLYHNLVRGVSRPRRNSFSMFWRRKEKKNNAAGLPALPDDGGVAVNGQEEEEEEEEEDKMEEPSSSQGNDGGDNVGKTCGNRGVVENGCQQDGNVGTLGADVGSADVSGRNRCVGSKGGRGVDANKCVDKVGSKCVANGGSVCCCNDVGKRVGNDGGRVNEATHRVGTSGNPDHRTRMNAYQNRKGKARSEPTTEAEGEIGELPTGIVVSPHGSRSLPRCDLGSVEYAVILNPESDLDDLDPEVTGEVTTPSGDDLPPLPQPRPRHPPREDELSTEELYINTHALRRNLCTFGSGQESNASSTSTSDTDSLFDDDDGDQTEEEERCIYTGVTYLKEGLRLRRHSAKPRIDGGGLIEPHPSFHSATTLPLSSKEAMAFTKSNSNITTTSADTTTTATGEGAVASGCKDALATNTTPATTTSATPSVGGPPPISSRSNFRIFQPHLANNPIYRNPEEALSLARSAFDVGQVAFVPRRRHSAGPCPDGARTCGEEWRLRRALDINANLKKWRRKERWLEKRRRCQRYRGIKVSDVDIAIIHAPDADDYAKWIENFFQELPQEHRVRVECRFVEELYNTSRKIETKQICGAKLQIVVISSEFLTSILKYTVTPLGEKLQHDRVLAVVGVPDHKVTDLHRNVLFSYDEWEKLNICDREYTAEEIISLGTKIINDCDLFKGYQDQKNARFKITPTKVKQVDQGNVYIILQEPVDRVDKVQVNLVVKGRKSMGLSGIQLKMRNPYTISFKVPEYLLNGLTILSVEVLIDKESLGCRELKCESKLDTLEDILNSFSNPIEIMCQALNINVSNEWDQMHELDRRLAESLRMVLSPQQFPRACEPVQDVSENISFPTWLHFSAHYGLEQLTDALLQVPGAESQLNVVNNRNLSPAELACEQGFLKLSRELKEYSHQPLEEPPPGRMYHSGGSAETLVMEVPYLEPPLPRPIACSPSPTPELEATSTNSLSSNVLCSSNNPCNPTSCQSLVGQYDTLPDPKPIPAMQDVVCNGENFNPVKEYLNMSGSKDNSVQDGKKQLTPTTSIDSLPRKLPDINDYITDPTALGQSKNSTTNSNSFGSVEGVWAESETEQYEAISSLGIQVGHQVNPNLARMMPDQGSHDQSNPVAKERDVRREGQVINSNINSYIRTKKKPSGYARPKWAMSSETKDHYMTPDEIHHPTVDNACCSLKVEWMKKL